MVKGRHGGDLSRVLDRAASAFGISRDFEYFNDSGTLLFQYDLEQRSIPNY
ncbi:hypothetical protein D3C87_2062410 [compost metagenome]